MKDIKLRIKNGENISEIFKTYKKSEENWIHPYTTINVATLDDFENEIRLATIINSDNNILPDMDEQIIENIDQNIFNGKQKMIKLTGTYILSYTYNPI